MVVRVLRIPASKAESFPWARHFLTAAGEHPSNLATSSTVSNPSIPSLHQSFVIASRERRTAFAHRATSFRRPCSNVPATSGQHYPIGNRTDSLGKRERAADYLPRRQGRLRSPSSSPSARVGSRRSSYEVLTPPVAVTSASTPPVIFVELCTSPSTPSHISPSARYRMSLRVRLSHRFAACGECIPLVSVGPQVND
jgi:hypothetical protein